MSQAQQELPVPFPELARDLPLLPVRMLNEFQYCPRLAYLECVQGEWAESADTTEGRHVHGRVDKGSGKLPKPEDIDAHTDIHARSITLSSNELGLISKLDLIEAEDGLVVPVDYKRGKRPHVAGGAYDPERVQLCAQGLILEANGYRVQEGILSLAESRERVAVQFDDELRALTRNAISVRTLSRSRDHPSAVRLSHDVQATARVAGSAARASFARGARRLPELRDEVAIVDLASKDDRIFVVTYDIRDQLRSRRLFRLMNGYGEWLQLSVFQCRLSRRRHTEMIALVDGIILHGHDHVVILDVGPADGVDPRVVSLGKDFNPIEREAIVV